LSIGLKPGMRLFGAACETEIIVVKCAPGDVDLRIGGHPALTSAEARNLDLGVVAGHDVATAMGKRYADGDATIELLCTRAGAGALAVGDTVLQLKDAKPLPASD
jgi:hypothetical protein